MKHTLLFALIAISFISCNKSDDAVVTPAGLDLKMGTSWTYKYTDYDAAGAVISTSNITLTVTSQATMLGESWWVATGGGSPSYMRKEATGYYTIRNSVKQLDFKVPAVLNDTWRKTYSGAVNDYSDFKVLALAQNVTVPFGTIACYYAEGNDNNSLEDKIWYNDANMMVKQIEYDQVGVNPVYVDYTLELVSYTP
jgi:hypothetical protein